MERRQILHFIVNKKDIHSQTFALILQVHRAKNLIKRHENIHSWKERGRSIAEVEGAYFTKYLQKTMRENKIVIES